MYNTPNNNIHIAKNTALLIMRMLVVMIINFYSIRIVLNSLGVQDYGIFSIISGVVTMLHGVSNVLSNATQRFYSIAISEKNTKRLRDVFSTSLSIQLILSVIIVIIGETVGLWFVNSQLNIPDDRIIPMNWLYQTSIFSFIALLLQTPYSSATIAYENVKMFSIFSLLDSLLKLGASLLIPLTPIDGLITYGILLLLVSIIILVLFISFVQRNHTDIRYQKPKEKKIYRELLSFSGWSLFGSLAGVGMFQVNTILINIFFGLTTSAARAISLQFNMAINSFVSSIVIAIKPRMVMLYAEGSYDYLNKIFYLSTKIIYYILLAISLPFLLEMEYILTLWIGYSNPQTALFSRLIVIYALIMALNNPISIIIQATGHVREYHTIVEIFTILCAPLTYVFFKMGYPAYFSNIVMIIASIASHFIRLICLKKFYRFFSYYKYLITFVLPALLITIGAFVLIKIIKIFTLNNQIGFMTIFILTFIWVTFLVYNLGLTKKEKFVLSNILSTNKKII